jgi:hypothetical protein
MGVHVDEIHTQVSSSAPATEPGAAAGPGGGADAAPARPGTAEETWRRTMARVTQLRCRVAAEGFDD